MASIRFIKNLNLKNVFDGQEAMVPVAAGDIIEAQGIQMDDDNYCDITLCDGSIFRGVAAEVFENHRQRVPVTKVSTIEQVEENVEIDVPEPEPEAPALMEGTMLSNEGEPAPEPPVVEETEDEYYGEPEPPVTPPSGYTE
jgi:hypothetical protein